MGSCWRLERFLVKKLCSDVKRIFQIGHSMKLCAKHARYTPRTTVCSTEPSMSKVAGNWAKAQYFPHFEKNYLQNRSSQTLLMKAFSPSVNYRLSNKRSVVNHGPYRLLSSFSPQNRQPNIVRDNSSVVVSSGLLEPVKCFKDSLRGVSTEKGTQKAKVRGIQKDVSPLTTKRFVRRKKTKGATAQDKEVFDVTAYATAEEINLETVTVDLERQGLYQLVKLPDDADALHAEARYLVDDEPREIFIFREGSVIFWNIHEDERNSVMKFLRRHQTDSYDVMLIKSEFEDFEFTFTDATTRLVGDEIQIQKGETPETQGALHEQLEKYTFSNALAHSVKLGIWEASLEQYVDSIEWVLQDLKEGRKLRITRDQMLRKTGELLKLRHLMNLSSDLLDTPDFYWDRKELEPLYTKTTRHLSVPRRIKVMNEKLTHCSELAELVTSHLNDKHHIRLEWMIIILIMVEVGFEIIHLVERWGGEKEASTDVDEPIPDLYIPDLKSSD